MEQLNIKFNNQEYVASQYWWENQDFHIIADNKEYVFGNCWTMSLHYDGLEYSSDDSVMIENNFRYGASGKCDE